MDVTGHLSPVSSLGAAGVPSARLSLRSEGERNHPGILVVLLHRSKADPILVSVKRPCRRDMSVAHRVSGN